MRQITKDFMRLAVAADPSRSDLIASLVIHQRFAPSVVAGSVMQVKGGLQVTSGTDPFALHLIDEDNITCITVILNEEAAASVGVHSIAQLLRHNLEEKAA
ncbi:hypothetical protein [Methylorubrum extorquens]|uniref:hypothetical protein n=1 Tax=Methylorubrum extorquens TaxID=408 RepID=UPI00209F8E54|nr:hypothetical protein [Methylorubrum extorquens]MCP1540105.1 hypothetical protein [Methylorubrum extorquens]